MKNIIYIFLHYLTIYKVIGLYGFLVASAFQTDNFALMSGTLRTFQTHACDGEELSIKCLDQTVISIKFAHYGGLSAQNGLCKSESLVTSNSSTAPSCASVNALKVIEEKCQEQTVCRLFTSAKVFKEDPCPGFRKYAEVAYKCRPAEFVNKIACESDSLILSCSDSFKILIYSASFGNSRNGVDECPKTTVHENKEICQSSYSTERVIAKCQGKQRCIISADTETFGNPGCSNSISKYLKVLFKCVPSEILKEIKESPLPTDDVIETSKEVLKVHSTSYPAWASGMDLALPPLNKPFSSNYPLDNNMQQDDITSRVENDSHSHDRKVVEFVGKWISAHSFLARNTQKLILYMSISLGVGLTLFITVIIVHICLTSSAKGKSDVKLDTPTKSADDFFTDSDLEHFEGVEPIDESNTRKISDAIPRAPVTSQTSNHYFS